MDEEEIRYLMRKYGYTYNEAKALIEEEDKEVERLYNEVRNNPSIYDLIKIAGIAFGVLVGIHMLLKLLLGGGKKKKRKVVEELWM